jgi:hypothetical protein
VRPRQHHRGGGQGPPRQERRARLGVTEVRGRFGGMENCVLGKGLVFLFKWYLWDIRKRTFGRIWAEHNGDISKIGDFTCWFK